MELHLLTKPFLYRISANWFWFLLIMIFAGVFNFWLLKVNLEPTQLLFLCGVVLGIVGGLTKISSV